MTAIPVFEGSWSCGWSQFCPLPRDCSSVFLERARNSKIWSLLIFMVLYQNFEPITCRLQGQRLSTLGLEPPIRCVVYIGVSQTAAKMCNEWTTIFTLFLTLNRHFIC